MSKRLLFLRSASGLIVLACGMAAFGQTHVGVDGAHPATTPKDSSMLTPPAGHKVAVIEWTDLECPACAHAFPIVHAAVDTAKIPLVHYDFLISGHIWSPMAAVYARYFQDRVSPSVGTDYRRQVFASQFRIASLDDLQAFTKQFAASHHVTLPFVVDPNSELRHKVDAERELGKRMGLNHTPTIFVVTANEWIDVANPDLIVQAIRQAQQDAAKQSAVPASHARH